MDERTPFAPYIHRAHDVERVVEWCCGSFSGALVERRTGKGYLSPDVIDESNRCLAAPN
jgi:hypothetical protein